ncbi:MAG: DUF1844 domain-containing protein [Fidelibacterota bacterium]
MTNERLDTDEQLFVGLISSFASSAWVALGKIKNPVTDKIERNLEQASYAIDMLDMIHRRMGDNLNDAERKFLQSTLGDLKLNYVEEKKKPDTEPDPSSDEETDEFQDEAKSDADNKPEQPQE